MVKLTADEILERYISIAKQFKEQYEEEYVVVDMGQKTFQVWSKAKAEHNGREWVYATDET